jgi:DNA-binding beta-propeller fold protein YncE
VVLSSVGLASSSPLEFLTTWGSNGGAESQFNGAIGLAVDDIGTVYVADTFNFRIQKFDADGNFISTWGWGVQDGSNAFQVCSSGCQAGLSGFGDGQLTAPNGIAVGGGRVYVADTNNDRVQKFSTAGTYSATIGAGGFGAEGELDQPRGVAVDAFTDPMSFKLYVAEESNHRVSKFDTAGNFERMWGWGVQDGSSTFQVCISGCQPGISGSGLGQFNFPGGIAVDAVGNVWVVDQSNHRVQKFDSDGNFLTTWGSNGTGDGEFAYPSDVDIDPSGRLYVSEAQGDRIQVFDADGNFLGKAGTSGAAPGELDGARGIGLDAQLGLYVIENFNDRVSKFSRRALESFIADRR